MKKTVVLSLMMFLTFMMFPVWFVPMFPYVGKMPGGEHWAIWCSFLMGIGTFASPLIGMFADRYLNAERVLGICFAISGSFLCAAFFAPTAGILFWLLLGAVCFYMPTWALTFTILILHAPSKHFPWMRSLGTAGWVAAGGFSAIAAAFGFKTFDASNWIFAAGAATSFAGALLTFLLPPTEPKAKGTPLSVADALGLKALVLFKDRSFRSFVLVLLFATLPYQWYYVYSSQYLADSGFNYLTLTLNLGQVGEVGFLLVIPWMIKRFGYKRCLVIAFCALIFRNTCFALSSAGISSAFNFGGILIHGLVFGLISLGGQFFANDNAPDALRSQAQGLITMLLIGLGTFASNCLFDRILRHVTADGTRPWTTAYLVAIGLSLVGIVLTLACVREKKKD